MDKEVISGIVVSIRYAKEGSTWRVFMFDTGNGKPIKAVGNTPPIEVGDYLQLVGRHEHHDRHGDQFTVINAEQAVPTQVDSIYNYLASGAIKGVGEATAKLLLAHFGSDVFDVIEYDHGRLCEITGIGAKRSQRIHEAFMLNRGMVATHIELQQLGLTSLQVAKVIEKYGDDCVKLINENPYRLIDDFDGIGFITADKIALKAGTAHDSQFRIMAYITFMLNELRAQGSTYIPINVAINRAKRSLGVDEEVVDYAIHSMLTSNMLNSCQINDEDVIFNAFMYSCEQNCANRLVLLAGERPLPFNLNVDDEIDMLELHLGITLAKTQRLAVHNALTQGVMVITGGPGTGKTTILRFIIGIMQKLSLEFELCAPTGRAAKRMAEATGVEARTIHRLLESNGKEFGRDASNPIFSDMIIIDEMSMVDVVLLSALLKAITPQTRLIMVGDADQLPSVGPGNVLADIISCSFIPVIRLSEIFRQSDQSSIIINAHMINRGEHPLLSYKDREFRFERMDDMNEIANRICQLCTIDAEGELFDTSIRNIQVLTPMKDGILGVNELNLRLQAAVNPPDFFKREREFAERIIFREGDKIMQTKNNYALPWKIVKSGVILEEGVGVFNGDMGTIVEIDSMGQYVLVNFDDGREVLYSFAQLEELSHAFCITIHKSQGSEFPVVILPLCRVTPKLATRNLLYTAITRAQKQVYIIGRQDCVYSMIDTIDSAKRYSALSNFIEEYAFLLKVTQ